MKKNQPLYFVNYEGRRDASAASGLTRTVPTETLKQGIILYPQHGRFRFRSGRPPRRFSRSMRRVLGINAAALKALPAQDARSAITRSIGDQLKYNRVHLQRARSLGWKTLTLRNSTTRLTGQAVRCSLAGTCRTTAPIMARPTPRSFPGSPANSVSLANSKGLGESHWARRCEAERW